MVKKEEKIYSHLPTCPGVYLMKNAQDAIIYIGKSNNLKSRVRSYFVAGAELNFAKKKMVKVVEKIDYIETKTDIEALMLETNLIKKNQPKYNVLMKDGKNLSYIKITDDEIPCLVRTRIKTKHGQYFWPYSQYFDTYSFVRFTRKLFRLGNHEKIEKFWPPCMDTYIGLCPGHCTGDINALKTYKERLGEARDFLMGKQDTVIDDLKKKMKQAADERKYEEASEYKNLITQIETTGNRQIVRDAIDGDATVAVMLEKYNHIFLSFVEVKNGMIVGVHEYELANPLQEQTPLLVEQALIHYLIQEEVKTLYTDISLEWFSDMHELAQTQKISLRHPSRGEKVRILEFAHTNLLNFAYQEEMSWLKNATLSKKTMIDLLEKLWFETKELSKKKEIVFECFDISHSHGEHTVASKSVLVNGKPDTKRYKKYRIKTLETGKIDDFASMEEILTRRSLGAVRGEDPWPDLIIIDGGKWQLSHATEAIGKASDDFLPPIISLAKRIEEIFLPKKSNPTLLEKWSPELMILQKIRDEAHRFAINYNRSSREKSYTKTLLDEIPWIGPVARQKILKSVSKIEELSSWTFEKSQKLFWKKVAEALQNHGLISDDDPSTEDK
jgi:excinuclease ABC subunit C